MHNGSITYNAYIHNSLVNSLQIKEEIINLTSVPIFKIMFESEITFVFPINHKTLVNYNKLWIISWVSPETKVTLTCFH